MTLTWVIGANVGVITARYFKFGYWWYWIHVVLFSVVNILTLISAFGAYDEAEAPIDVLMQDEDKLHHSRIGWTITFLILG